MTSGHRVFAVALLIFGVVSSGCGIRREILLESSEQVSIDRPYEMPKLYVHGVTGEAGRPVRFFVMLDKPARSVVRVQLNTIDDTATAPDDHSPYSAELTLAPGETMAEIEVLTYISPTDRGTLQFYLEASEVVGAQVWKARGMALITPPIN